MTDCTNTYSCTAAGCPPCGTTNAWLTAGWIGQGLLLLAGGVLAVLAVTRWRPCALLLGPLTAALMVVSTALAVAAG